MVDIHFVLPQLTPFYGMEKAATLLMIGLQRDGVAVSATVLSGGVPPAATGLRVTALDLPRRPTRLGAAVPVLRRRLCALPPGTRIVASGLWASAPVGLALAGTGRSYTSWEHSVLPARLALDRRVALLFRLVWTRHLRPASVIAVSEGVRRTVTERAGAEADVAVIPNVVETPDRSPAPRPVALGTVSLLTTGAFRQNKNYSCAVEAMRHLPSTYRLTMAGDGPQSSRLRRLAADLGVEDRIVFLGRIDDVRPFLDRSDVLVHPSLFETFGLSLVEAADHGLPVVTLPVPSLDELIPHYVPGVMSDGTTPRALADAVQTLVRDGVSGRDLERAWERRRRRFSVAAVCAQWRAALAVRGCSTAA